MRNALGLMLASVVAAVVIAGVLVLDFFAARRRGRPPNRCRPRRPSRCRPRGQAAAKDDVEVTAALVGQAAAAPRRRPRPHPSPAQPKSACANPDALGVSRTVVIDTTGGPGFGFEHYKQFDFLTDKEVVLTFDDGPWPTTRRRC